ncbi:MAG: hypothetical protein HW412_176, partial [Bacteroidetes bacterium]|nr:hypothetical protein [Bacteroidota bacterium]
MNTKQFMQLVCILAIVGVLAVVAPGCKDDATTTPGPTAFSSNSTSLTVAPSGTT